MVYTTSDIYWHLYVIISILMHTFYFYALAATTEYSHSFSTISLFFLFLFFFFTISSITQIMHLVSSGLWRKIRVAQKFVRSCFYHPSAPGTLQRRSYPLKIGYFHNNEIYLSLKTTSYSHAIRSVLKVGRPGRTTRGVKRRDGEAGRRRANTYATAFARSRCALKCRQNLSARVARTVINLVATLARLMGCWSFQLLRKMLNILVLVYANNKKITFIMITDVTLLPKEQKSGFSR